MSASINGVAHAVLQGVHFQSCRLIVPRREDFDVPGVEPVDQAVKRLAFPGVGTGRAVNNAPILDSSG